MILELSSMFPIKMLCQIMGRHRSSFYNWKKNLSHPSNRTKNLIRNILSFQKYHMRFPSHGYRWLNAKIRLDTGLLLSAPYAHKCCRAAGIKSQSKHYSYRKAGEISKVFPNLLLAGMNPDGPMQCTVSDMTAFHVKGIYYELTLYMDLWNNEIVSHALSSKRGDRMTYISGLRDLIELKKENPDYEMILHSEQYNHQLEVYHIIRSMSRAGTPTDNAAMEAVNGWIKSEIFKDFHVTGESDVAEEIKEYVSFFNEERPACLLNHMTPRQYKEEYLSHFYQ